MIYLCQLTHLHPLGVRYITWVWKIFSISIVMQSFQFHKKGAQQNHGKNNKETFLAYKSFRKESSLGYPSPSPHFHSWLVISCTIWDVFSTHSFPVPDVGLKYLSSQLVYSLLPFHVRYMTSNWSIVLYSCLAHKISSAHCLLPT